MSDLIAEPTGEAIQGTDQAAHSVTKPAVEVTFAVNRTGANPLDAESARAARISAGIARMQALGATQGKAVEPAKEPAPEAAAEPAAVDGTIEAEPAATADEVAADEVEESATPDAAAEGDAAADEPEAKPDPVEVAAYKAELDTTAAELALARVRLEQAERGGVSDDDRAAWIDRPVDSVRALVARMLGVPTDAKEVGEELAHLQRELTIEAIGLDSLPDDRKHQRTSERFERSERLKQTVRTASAETAKQTQQRAQVVSHVASVIEATRDEFPHLATAAALNGAGAVAEGAIAYWLTQVQRGRIKGTGDDTKDVREALRLTNDLYSTKLAKSQPTNTAPPPATAPAPASTKEAAPGAPASTKSTAPAKPGSATPRTLSAKQAAAAPIARTAPATKPPPSGPVTIDPNDRGARDKRRLEIGRRNLATK